MTTSNERSWYVLDPEGGVEEYGSEPEAHGAAHALMCHYREIAEADGEWADDMERLEWGEMVPRERAIIETMMDDDGREYCDFSLASKGGEDG